MPDQLLKLTQCDLPIEILLRPESIFLRAVNGYPENWGDGVQFLGCRGLVWSQSCVSKKQLTGDFMDRPKKEISLSKKEAWRLYELLEVMHDFLHQSAYSQEDVEKWLKSGVYKELKHAYYDIVSRWFPVDEETGFVSPPKGVKRRFPCR